MALSYKARRRWSLVLLLVWLPAYVVFAIGLVNRLGDLPVAVELLVYAFLGIAWALPFRFVFRGIGKPDPEENAPPQSD